MHPLGRTRRTDRSVRVGQREPGESYSSVEAGRSPAAETTSPGTSATSSPDGKNGWIHVHRSPMRTSESPLNRAQCTRVFARSPRAVSKNPSFIRRTLRNPQRKRPSFSVGEKRGRGRRRRRDRCVREELRHGGVVLVARLDRAFVNERSHGTARGARARTHTSTHARGKRFCIRARIHTCAHGGHTCTCTCTCTSARASIELGAARRDRNTRNDRQASHEGTPGGPCTQYLKLCFLPPPPQKKKKLEIKSGIGRRR